LESNGVKGVDAGDKTGRKKGRFGTDGQMNGVKAPSRRLYLRHTREKLALLPQSVRKERKPLDDDF
jgi:hypothetical protein